MFHDRRRLGAVRAPYVAAGGGSLLLDSLSVQPLMAYSSRKLRSAYAGSALKVRRSTGGTQDIGFSGNDLDTGALATFVGANSGFIDTWYDQTTNVTNASQATTTNQPRIVNAGTNDTLNSRVAPRWLGGSENLVFTITQSQPLSYCFCVKLNTLVAGGHFTDSNVAGRVIVGVSGGPPPNTYQLYANAAVTGGTLNTSIHATFALFGSGLGDLYVDGSQVITAGSTSNGGLSGATMLGAGLGPGAMDGQLAEFMLFGTSALTSGDRALIRASWQSYWGTP